MYLVEIFKELCFKIKCELDKDKFYNIGLKNLGCLLRYSNMFLY